MSEPDNDGCIRLTPSLLRAIEDHKYLRSCECCREVSLREAADEFRAAHEDRWREAKLRADNARQIQEMQKHLWIESQKAGHDVGRNSAGTEWVTRFAGTWRQERESLRGNDFLDIEVTVGPDSELERAGAEGILARTSSLSCDVFAAQDGLTCPDFLLQPEPGTEERPFIHVRPGRPDALANLDLSRGSRVLFVAYGKDARAALQILEAASRARVAAR